MFFFDACLSNWNLFFSFSVFSFFLFYISFKRGVLVIYLWVVSCSGKKSPVWRGNVCLKGRSLRMSPPRHWLMRGDTSTGPGQQHTHTHTQTHTNTHSDTAGMQQLSPRSRQLWKGWSIVVSCVYVWVWSGCTRSHAGVESWEAHFGFWWPQHWHRRRRSSHIIDLTETKEGLRGNIYILQ